jgi:hypothetical protein
MKLQELLEKNIDIDKIEQRFKEIADLLFQKYYIKKGDDKYEFLEMEFYYYTKGHKDISTYRRNVEGGKWFFHNSGVDISFKSVCKNINLLSEDDYFGGILIRSLLKNGTEVIHGPLKCIDALFYYLDAFEIKEEEIPLIKKSDKIKDCSVLQTTRYTSLSEEKAKQRFGDGYGKLYRFYIQHPKWAEVKKSDK